MKKSVKRAIVLVVVCMMAISTTLVASANHTKPDGGTCNNTIVKNIHTGVNGAKSGGSHMYNEYQCNITVLLGTHTARCTSCNANLGANPFYCTWQHSAPGCGQGYHTCTK